MRGVHRFVERSPEVMDMGNVADGGYKSLPTRASYHTATSKNQTTNDRPVIDEMHSKNTNERKFSSSLSISKLPCPAYIVVHSRRIYHYLTPPYL